jgi:hypothetical protein
MMKVIFAMMVVIAVEWLNRIASVTTVLLHAVLCASTHILKEFFAVMLVAVVGVVVEWLNRIGTVFVAISTVKGMAMVFVVDALHRFGDLFAPCARKL